MTTSLRILRPIGLARDGARRSMLNFLAGGPAPDSEEVYKVCSIVPDGLDVSEDEQKDVGNISGGNCIFKEPGRKGRRMQGIRRKAKLQPLQKFMSDACETVKNAEIKTLIFSSLCHQKPNRESLLSIFFLHLIPSIFSSCCQLGSNDQLAIPSPNTYSPLCIPP